MLGIVDEIKARLYELTLLRIHGNDRDGGIIRADGCRDEGKRQRKEARDRRGGCAAVADHHDVHIVLAERSVIRTLALVAEVEKVFHREFSHGMFYGRPGVNQLTDSENSLAKSVKRHIGIVIDYFIKAGIAQIKIQDHSIEIGDTIQIHGSTTGVKELKVEAMRRDEEIVTKAERGTWVTLKAPRCRVGDKVFYIETRDLKDK